MKIEVRGKVASGITAKILFLPLSAKLRWQAEQDTL